MLAGSRRRVRDGHGGWEPLFGNFVNKRDPPFFISRLWHTNNAFIHLPLQIALLRCDIDPHLHSYATSLQ